MKGIIGWIMVLVMSTSLVHAHEPAIDVGHDKQLFIDSKFIAESHDVELTANPPRKAGFAIQRDKPWESGALAGGMILQESDRIRLYYVAMEFTEPGAYGTTYSCYAESKDGINWTKPNLGQVEYKGSKDNNILSIEAGNVFIDPKASPEQKYKMLAQVYGMGNLEKGGLYIYTSADGTNWMLHSTRLFPFFADGTNQIEYDPVTDKYLAYYRQWFPRSAGTIYTSRIKPLRTVGMSVLDDPMQPWVYDKTIPPFFIWDDKTLPTPSAESETAIGPDHLDPPETDFYGASVERYRWAKDVWIAVPSAFRHYPDPPDQFLNDGLVHIQLAVSRDGRHWTRFRQPYIEIGPEANGKESVGNYGMIGTVRSGDRIYHYYNSCFLNRRDLPTEGGYFEISRAEQRLDGFVSVDGSYTGGWLITPTIKFDGQKLLVNLDAGALGDAKVEILDEHGQPFPGFSAADADLIRGSIVDQPVSWRGMSDVSSLVGKNVRLRFHLRAAKLFAFQFLSRDLEAATRAAE